MALNKKILVVGKMRDGQVPMMDASDASMVNTFVLSMCFPKILNGRTENKVQF